MEFRILGPLQVCADGCEMSLGGPRSQRMLALLLLNANRVVTLTRLVAAAWDDEPPATARRQVVNRVAALRAGFKRLGGRIDTHDSGYRLIVGPGELDSLAFKHAVVEARAAQKPQDAVAILRAALALWSGPALAGLDGELIGREALALNETRLAALGDCIDQKLSLGAEAALVPELCQLVAEYRTTERFVGQWMVALYRTGRPGEALNAYRNLRDHLIEELGIEPGAHLRDLQLRVLNGEPSLSAGAYQAASIVPGPVIPRQLPVDVAGFTGRRAELARIETELGPNQGTGMAIVAIEGVGGIGKSALAIHAAHRVAERFPDGQLYVDLQGYTPGLEPLSPHEVLSRFLRALHAKSDEIGNDLSEVAARFRSEVAARRLLVVLDNARDAAQVVALLPGSRTCGVIVASRRLLTALEGAVHLRLDVLSPADSVAQLACILGRQRVTADPEAVAAVAEWCGHLPLALRVAGARLAARPGWPVRVLADRLGDAQARLDELEFTDAGVRASLAVSLEELRSAGDLDRRAADALVVLSLFDGRDLGIPTAASMLDCGPADAERVLERLVDANLMETPAYGRHYLHDLVRLFGREQATARLPEETGHAALERVLRFYTATVWGTFPLLRPGDHRPDRASFWSDRLAVSFEDACDALAWLEAELPNIVAAIPQAANCPGIPGGLAVELSQAMYACFRIRGYWAEAIATNQAILPVARRIADRWAEATACNDLGIALAQRGRWPEALARLGESLEIYKAIGDVHGEGQSLSNLGIVHGMMEHPESALACYEESLTVHRASGNLRGQAMSLGNLATTYRSVGRYADAKGCHERALKIFEELGDRYGQSVSLADFGTLLSRIGSFDESMACLRESLVICREMGDRFGEAKALTGIGVIHREQGRHEDALTPLREALAICRQLGRRDSQAENLREIGVTLRKASRPEQAAVAIREAAEIITELHGSEAEVSQILEIDTSWLEYG
jgi:DNA-binding SARP family transcriptional activator/Flp pilus assembly protein TadD